MRALQTDGETLLCGGAAGDGYEHKISELGVPFVPLPVDRRSLNPVADVRLFWTLYRWYRRERPDVVHHFTIKPVIYGSIAARLARVPRIVNTVTGLGYVFTNEAVGWLRRLVELQYRLALGVAHYTFFQNADDRQLFLHNRIVRDDKAGLLPGSGVDTTHFAPRPAAGAEPAGTPVVFLMVARLLRDKGLYEFVEAAGIVKAKYPQAEFQLLGARDDRNPTVVSKVDLDAWQAAGTVAWLGEVSDVRDDIDRADVVVLPSYREGTPRSLLEAASMGKSVIATDVAGCREAVDDGVTGLLVPVRDARALAAAMEALLLDPCARKRMGGAGREKMVRQFEEEQVIAKVLARYK
jgi:glycosyltransferase involved in cell wall biosynthesis